MIAPCLNIEADERLRIRFAEVKAPFTKGHRKTIELIYRNCFTIKMILNPLYASFSIGHCKIQLSARRKAISWL